MAAVRFILVHSPLVGPATWRWVAEALRSSGHDVAMPDLRGAAITGAPHAVVRAALQLRAKRPTVLVGHSGAGFVLPSIAAGLDPPVRRLVFVDAGVPPCEGEATPSADFIEQLRSLAPDGSLPKWSTWWGESVMENLVPDAARRAEIEAEMPAVPLAFFETAMPLPVGWCEGPGAFVLLSEPYRRDADTARSLGWPVVEDIGNHLDIVNDPESLARDLVALAR
jgi:pimeloyl-ACP methyl ester carboxylesterase